MASLNLPLDLIIIAVFVFGIAFRLGFSGGVFFDGDVAWHLATGQWVLDHLQVPTVDPFSFSAFGKPWIAHEWLSAVLMALAYNGFGYSGVAFLVALAIALTLLIIGLYVRRWADPVELTAILLTVVLVLNPFALARPMVLMWPMLAFWTVALLRAREEGRAPSWWLVPVMALWVNFHASFAVGLGMVGIFALEALIESPDKRRTLIAWGGFGLACTVAALLNPHGVQGLLLPLSVFTSTTVHVIREFKPTDFVSMPRFEFALLLLIGAALWRGARIAPLRLVLILGLLHLALAHMRHQTLFVIITALVAGPPLTRMWIAGAQPNPGAWASWRSAFAGKWAVAAGVVGLALWAGALALAAPVVPPHSAVNPVKAFAAIPERLRGQPVLNEYAFGGPLIGQGVKVYIDGRGDLYGDPFIAEYMRVWGGEPAAFKQAYDKWRFCWTIFPPDNHKLIQLLDGSPGWKRIYSDEFAIIHERTSCEASDKSV